MSRDVAPFLLEVVRAVSRAGTAVTEIQERLTRIASVGTHHLRARGRTIVETRRR